MGVIKLKQSDIENIVKQMVSEQLNPNKESIAHESEMEEQGTLYDDFDTQIQPEELPEPIELGMFTDDDGNYFVVDQRNPNKPRVIASTK